MTRTALELAFTTEIPIRFGESDPAGIVYTPNFFHYTHIAMEEFFTGDGQDYATLTSERRLGFPSVKIVAEFKRPLAFGSRARVVVTTPRLGDSSVDFRFEIHDERGLCATSQETKVLIDMTDRRPRPLPDDLRAWCERRGRVAPPAADDPATRVDA